MLIMKTWILRVILVGVVLDLAISGVLAYVAVNTTRNTSHLQQVTRTAQCWDRVLDHAVTEHQTPAAHAALVAEAVRCAKLLP